MGNTFKIGDLHELAPGTHSATKPYYAIKYLRTCTEWLPRPIGAVSVAPREFKQCAATLTIPEGAKIIVPVDPMDGTADDIRVSEMKVEAIFPFEESVTPAICGESPVYGMRVMAGMTYTDPEFDEDETRATARGLHCYAGLDELPPDWRWRPRAN